MLCTMARWGALSLMGWGGIRTSTCHVANAVEALLLAATAARSGQVYFITDGPPHTMRAFLAALVEAASGQPPPRMGWVPVFVAAALARLCDAVTAFTAGAIVPPLSSPAVCAFGRNVTVRSDKIRDQLGFKNVVSVEGGLQRVRQRRQQEERHRIGEAARRRLAEQAETEHAMHERKHSQSSARDQAEQATKEE